jgi:hypothetical protein
VIEAKTVAVAAAGPRLPLISPMNPAKMGPWRWRRRAREANSVLPAGLRVDMPHKTALESVSAIVLCGDGIGSSDASRPVENG